MVNIQYDTSKLQLRAEGHAEYAPVGQDIVCAAVSTLMLTLPLALNERGIRHEMHTDNDSGLMVIDAKPRADQRYPCLVVIETILTGLKELARSYPTHVTIDIKGGH